MKALIVVDVQNDLCEGGLLAIKGSLEIIPKINMIKSNFDVVIFSQDQHNENNRSFKQNEGKFLKHCVKDTYGSKLHSNLIINKNKDYIIHKGNYQNFSTNSAFYKANDQKTIIESGLKNILDVNKIKYIYICGLGMDHCLFNTIMDAYKFRYKIKIIKDCTPECNDETTSYYYNYIKKIGIIFLKTSDIIENRTNI